MTSATDDNELLLHIQAINVVDTTIPVNVLVQEAENLFLWCQNDRDQLIQAGLDWTKVDRIPICAKICREAQSMWLRDSKTINEVDLLCNAKSSIALDLLGEMSHDFLYAFRNDDQLLATLDSIVKVINRANMVQTLNDLAVMGGAHKPLLEVIRFDLAKLETAASLAPELASLIAQKNVNKKLKSESKEMRDKAYTYLKELVDQLRNCGKYKFRKNPERLAGYKSDYWKHKNIIRRKNPSQEDAPMTQVS